MESVKWNTARWTPWEQQARPMYLALTLAPSFVPLRDMIGQSLFTTIISFRNNSAVWAYREDEAAALGQRMLDYLSVPERKRVFTEGVAKSQIKLTEFLETAEAAVRSSTSIETVCDEIDDLIDCFTDFYRFGAFVEPVQTSVQSLLASSLARVAQELDMTDVEVKSAAFSLSTTSFAMERLAELGRVAEALAGLYPGANPEEVMYRTEIFESPLADLASFQRRFAWSLNNYDRCKTMTNEDVVREIFEFGGDLSLASKGIQDAVDGAAKVASTQGSLKREINARLSAHEAALLELHEFVGGRLVDVRKRLVMRANGLLTVLLKELAALGELDLNELLSLLPSEIRGAVGRPGRYQDRISDRQQDFLLYQAEVSVLDSDVDDGLATFLPMTGPVLAEGEDSVANLLGILGARLNCLAEAGSSNQPLKGTVAHRDPEKPTVRGIVSLVLTPEPAKMRTGSILVTSSTTPEFVPLMVRASAIITNWGGQTSHAAITARELNIPCIIGTDHATHQLRDGQTVELDFESGEIVVIADEEV